jgi:glycosyltransferase involved in cell wall biosynthesis
MKIYQLGAEGAEPREDRPTLAFATMCKNEEHIIGKVLEAVAPYIDYLVVADTGSTDNTIQIVKDFMHKHDIPGEIHQDDWVGFDKNKNRMMSYVFDKSDYVLHLDADDILAGDFSFTNEDRGWDNYLMTMHRGASTWKATVIYDNRMEWRFCGVAHTIIKCLQKPEGYRSGDLSRRGWVIADGVGSRAFDPKKFLWDAERLTGQFWDTLLEDPDGLNSRSVFYTAQSYMDYGQEDSLSRAIQWNRLYLKLKDTWIEERFEAQMRVAMCMMRLEGYTPEQIIWEMGQAIQIFPDRAEPHFRLGRYLNQIGRHEEAHQHLTRAKEINLEVVKQKYILFIDDTNYGDWINDELSVACYWTGRYEQGIQLIEQILPDPRWSGQAPRLLQNLTYLKQQQPIHNAED